MSTADSESGESESEEDYENEKDKAELMKYMSRIRDGVIKCDFELTFASLKEFEEKYLKKAK